MHVILLKFGDNKASASNYLEEHNDWIAKGVSDGVFQIVGSLDIGGGFILAHGQDEQAIQDRVEADPFVKHNVVRAEVIGVDVKRTSPQLEFLLAD